MISTFAALAEGVRRRPPRLGSVRLIAVDGPGGAGKSTFARRLAAALGGAPIVETDDFAGWDNPLDWWTALEDAVLAPLARGETARYPIHDWLSRQIRGWREVAPVGVVILEGVSSARAQAVDRLSFGVWIEAPEDLRLARGLTRDGEAARPDWERWMTEEDAHFATDRTRERADLVVDGASAALRDPELEFVVMASNR